MRIEILVVFFNFWFEADLNNSSAVNYEINLTRSFTFLIKCVVLSTISLVVGSSIVKYDSICKQTSN